MIVLQQDYDFNSGKKKKRAMQNQPPRKYPNHHFFAELTLQGPLQHHSQMKIYLAPRPLMGTHFNEGC